MLLFWKKNEEEKKLKILIWKKKIYCQKIASKFASVSILITSISKEFTLTELSSFQSMKTKKCCCSVLSFKNWCLIICFKFCCFLCRLAIIHRYKLWPSCGQPSTTTIHRKASSIHFNPKGPIIWIGPRYNQNLSQHRNWNCCRHCKWWHSRTSLWSQFCQELDQHKRVSLLSSWQYHPHHCRQRGHDFQWPESREQALTSNAKCVKAIQINWKEIRI